VNNWEFGLGSGLEFERAELLVDDVPDHLV
jgi:hypothetical protein